MVFHLAVVLIVVALTPLALPLLRLAWEAAPRRSAFATAVEAQTAGAASPERELERSVRDRLYGDRPKLTVTPIAGDGPPHAPD